jgi:hypothetical protein
MPSTVLICTALAQWAHRNYLKDRKIYRVVEARCTENGRCILVPGPKERVSRGLGFVGVLTT